MPRAAEIHLQWPSRCLSPNGRAHWKQVWQARAKQKQAARVCAWAVGVRRDWCAPVTVSVTFRPPNAQRRDLDNCIASVKAALDGLSDACGVDDSKFILTFALGHTIKHGAVIVKMTEGKDAAEGR